ncbi:MAG: hypothetical protein IPJ13_31865 [Saprospiraceae bacterium]|nr:hypothetical protein [Saprospiraceae bacterium]
MKTVIFSFFSNYATPGTFINLAPYQLRKTEVVFDKPKINFAPEKYESKRAFLHPRMELR